MHNWPITVRKMLIKKAWDSLISDKEEDTYIVIFDEFIYDELKRPLPFTMSLGMQVYSGGS